MHLKADAAPHLKIGLMCIVESGIEGCTACGCCTSIGRDDVIKSDDAVAERSKAQR